MLSLGIVLLLLAVLIVLNIQTCLKVKQGNGSGRTLSRIMAILMLLSFPIGTVLGVIALWKSSKINGSNKSITQVRHEYHNWYLCLRKRT